MVDSEIVVKVVRWGTAEMMVTCLSNELWVLDSRQAHAEARSQLRAHSRHMLQAVACMLSLRAKANSLLHRSALRRAAVSADACWVLLGRASPLPSIGSGFSMHDVDAVAAAAAGGRDLASARHARRTPGARSRKDD